MYSKFLFFTPNNANYTCTYVTRKYDVVVSVDYATGHEVGEPLSKSPLKGNKLRLQSIPLP